MPPNDDLPSSDDLIRQARAMTGETGSPRVDEDRSRSVVESGSDRGLVRPADRVAPPSSSRQRPRRGEIGHTPVVPGPTQTARGGWLNLVFGVPLLIFALLTVVTFIVGVVDGDPEVTENIAGYVILLALTAGPGTYLVRRYRRRRPGTAIIR